MRRTLSILFLVSMLGAPTLSSAQPGCAWSTDPGTAPDATLFGVDAVDPTNVWAAGSVRGTQGRSRTLVRHWDGTAWETQPTPNVTEQSNVLADVAAAPDGTAWAVGYRSRATAKTVVQRYDGTRWRMQRSLNPSEQLNELSGVDVTPSGDVYAVGSRWNSKRQHRTMIQHFDGTAWEIAPSRLAGLLLDIDAFADDDVWAVGAGHRGVVLHYDGAGWTRMDVPVERPVGLNGVSAAAPDDVWAVGWYPAEGGVLRPIVLHYDGNDWSVSDLPDLGAGEIELRSVSALSSDFAVIAGERDAGYQEDPRVLLEWNGSAWSEAPRDDDLESNLLQAVDVEADRSAWAVGYHSTSPQTSYVARRTCS